jgi:hypothetical protein
MLKKVLFFWFLAAVFSAVAVSALQLRQTSTAASACGTTCTSNLRCAGGCLCVTTQDGGERFCIPPPASAAAPSR